MKQTERDTTGGKMMKVKTSALIVAQPGPLRDSLRTFLMSLPQVKMVRLVEDIPSALQVVTEHNPDLVLVDANLPDNGVLHIPGKLKAMQAQSRCLILVDTTQQQRKAIAAGADTVLVKGVPAAKLFETIEELLSGTQWMGHTED
jgi:DNA-binding NarL/FixJ family response regulator